MQKIAIEYTKDGSGIFSNFMRVIDWLWYHDYSNVPLAINWKNQVNPNVDWGTDLLDGILKFNIKNENFQNSIKTYKWAEFCDLPIDTSFLKKRCDYIDFYNKYNLSNKLKSGGYFYTTPEVYKEKNFYKLRNIFNDLWNKYVVFDDLFLKEKNCNIVPENSNVLGVHLRYMGHYCHNIHNGPQLKYKNFYKENAQFIQKLFIQNKYDYIYVACDVIHFIEELKKIIPSEKLLYLVYNRCENDDDWETKKDFNMKTEIKNVFYDFINLSKTNHVTISASNMIFALLCFNNKMTYEFYPILSNLHAL